MYIFNFVVAEERERIWSWKRTDLEQGLKFLFPFWVLLLSSLFKSKPPKQIIALKDAQVFGWPFCFSIQSLLNFKLFSFHTHMHTHFTFATFPIWWSFLLFFCIYIFRFYLFPLCVCMYMCMCINRSQLQNYRYVFFKFQVHLKKVSVFQALFVSNWMCGLWRTG